MAKTFALLFCVATAMTARSLDAATLEFRAFINGVEAPNHNLTPGSMYTLTIEGRVVDNLLPGGVNGGIFQAVVNIDADGDLEFEEEQGFLGSTGSWESTFNSDFGLQLKGVLDGNGYSVFGQTGAIKPGAYPSHVTTIGASGWSYLYSGKFKYSNGARAINVTAVQSENLIASVNDSGGVSARNPDTVVGVSLILVPEPATIVMSSLGLLGVIAARRRHAFA